MFSTFSRCVPSTVLEAWNLFVSFLVHVAFNRLDSHTPFPGLIVSSVNIPLQFQCILYVINFTIANTVINNLILRSSCHTGLSLSIDSGNRTWNPENNTTQNLENMADLHGEI